MYPCNIMHLITHNRALCNATLCHPRTSANFGPPNHQFNNTIDFTRKLIFIKCDHFRIIPSSILISSVKYILNI